MTTQTQLKTTTSSLTETISQTTDTARFISFEGTEGVGKTTAIDALCQRLKDQGIDHIRTREPGGSVLGEKLRAILLSPDTDISDDTELLLMYTARCDHLQQVIIPALANGQWVICDRFADSSFAYQGYGRSGGDAQMLNKIQQLTDGFVSRQPDLTLWLDLPVAEGMQRAGKRSVADRFEQEAVAFFQRVYQGYQWLAEHQPERFQRIDASGSSDAVAKRIWDMVKP